MLQVRMMIPAFLSFVFFSPLMGVVATNASVYYNGNYICDVMMASNLDMSGWEGMSHARITTWFYRF